MNIKVGILVGLLILTSPAVALTVQQQHYQAQLSSTNFRQVQNAFENIVLKHENNPEILDLAAQILIEHIPFHRQKEEDTLAWACRALGESNSTRYVQLLSKIINGNASKKIKKYASKALKKTFPSNKADSYVAGTVNLVALHEAYQAREKYTPSEKHIINIANDNLFEIKLLSEEIYQGKNVSPLTLDLLAQFLSENNKNVNNKNADTLAWVCKAIAKAGKSRYKNTIEEIIRTTDSRRVRSHCKKANKSLFRDSTTDSYTFGDVNISTQIKKISIK